MIGFLPNHMLNAVRGGKSLCFLVLLSTALVQQNCLMYGWGTPALKLGNSLNRPLHKSKGVARAWLEQFGVDMQMDVRHFARATVQKGSVTPFALSFATEKNRRAWRYYSSPCHPMCGTAP